MLQKYLAQPQPNDVDKRSFGLSHSEQERCDPTEYLLTPKVAARCSGSAGVTQQTFYIHRLQYYLMRCVTVNILLK